MDSSPPSLYSVPPSMSRNCFPDSDHFVIGTTYGLSQNLGNKLTSSKQLKIYFKDIEDVTVNLLSAICSEYFHEVANTESKHPHPQSMVSVSFSSGKSWTSLLGDNELQARVKRWKYPKNPHQRKLVAFSVRCCADGFIEKESCPDSSNHCIFRSIDFGGDKVLTMVKDHFIRVPHKMEEKKGMISGGGSFISGNCT
ncbi:hypothetical protein GEMRC1_014169 [Eukaryota sp. GEM-RC1]